MLTIDISRDIIKFMKKLYFDEVFENLMKNSDFKKRWENEEPDFQAGITLIKGRISAEMSQRQLAKKAKTTQAVISRVERMTVSPTLDLLQRIAEVFGKKLEIKFA